ncbi:MAG TPA: hypothetical protein VK304_11335 [Thermoleophilaceae bacterium]|nr:hypothetical protein [Thermoleophilaceae bacterium]
MDGERRRRRREQARRRTKQQRLIALGLALGLLAVIVVAATAGGGEDLPERTAEAERPPEPPQLPRGGRTLFPERRVVAFYGAPQNEELGALGIGTPAQAGRRLERQARRYVRAGRPVLPAFELISTMVHRTPGKDGKFSTRQKPATIDRYLREARRRRALLILDIQPGRASFMDETRALRRWLEQPDVALALDPEWSMAPGEIPGQSIGSTDARTVNQVAAYLSRLVRRRDLPQKLLLVHRFTADMIEDERSIRDHRGLAMVLNVDGFGTQAEKKVKYREFTRGRRRERNGFKLFYREDTGLMTPRQTLRLRPSPDVVAYE